MSPVNKQLPEDQIINLQSQLAELAKINEQLRLQSASSIEIENLQVEKNKLQLEQEKFDFEKSKKLFNAFVGIIPLLGIIATILYGIWSQRQADQNTFQLKAAELMFNSQDSYEARTNGRILTKLFPDKLPADFSDRFDPDQISGYDSYLINSKKDLLKLISSDFKHKDSIVIAWKEVFPSDTWPDSLLKK